MQWSYEHRLAEMPTTTNWANTRPIVWQVTGICLGMVALGAAAAFGFASIALFGLPPILEVMLVAWSLGMTAITGRITGKLFWMLKRKA